MNLLKSFCSASEKKIKEFQKLSKNIVSFKIFRLKRRRHFLQYQSKVCGSICSRFVCRFSVTSITQVTFKSNSLSISHLTSLVRWFFTVLQARKTKVRVRNLLQSESDFFNNFGLFFTCYEEIFVFFTAGSFFGFSKIFVLKAVHRNLKISIFFNSVVLRNPKLTIIVH